jgi:hypothetical protein
MKVHEVRVGPSADDGPMVTEVGQMADRGQIRIPKWQHPDEREARAVGAGAPKLEDVLTTGQLDMLAGIAVEASPGNECGAFGSPGVDSCDAAVGLFARMLAQSTEPCQFVFFEPREGTTVVTAFTGNGPKARETARLYAVARDAILALVLHARAKQQEVDTLRRALDTLTSVHSAPYGEEGGAD